MLTERFEQLLRGLISAFLRYDDTPRDAAHVTQLAMARSELEDLRAKIARERIIGLGLGRSRARDDHWREAEAEARSQLFTIANTSN